MTPDQITPRLRFELPGFDQRNLDMLAHVVLSLLEEETRLLAKERDELAKERDEWRLASEATLQAIKAVNANCDKRMEQAEAETQALREALEQANELIDDVKAELWASDTPLPEQVKRLRMKCERLAASSSPSTGSTQRETVIEIDEDGRVSPPVKGPIRDGR